MPINHSQTTAIVGEAGWNADHSSPTAEEVSYDNATSGLTATDVQAAIDETGHIRKATVTLTDAQIKALPTTGVEVLPALAGNKHYAVLHADLALDSAAGAYTNLGETTGNLFLLASTSSLPMSVGMGLGALYEFLGVAAYTVVAVPPYTEQGDIGAAITAWPSGDARGSSVVLKANAEAGDWTGGNAANTLKVTVLYVVVDL